MLIGSDVHVMTPLRSLCKVVPESIELCSLISRPMTLPLLSAQFFINAMKALEIRVFRR